jgi:PAS domain S-box-containing protein
MGRGVLRSSELLEAILSLTEALVVVFDEGGRVRLFNPACERASGFRADEVQGRLLAEVLPDTERLLERGSAEIELEWVGRDGRPARIAWRRRRLRDPETGAVSVLAVGRDVTKLRVDEAALRDRTARLDAFLRASHDGVITIREDGVVTSFSAGAERQFGYVAAEVIGRNVSLLMPAPYAEAHDGYLAEYRRTGRARIIGVGREVAARRRDGSTFPVHLMVEEGRIGEMRFFTGVVRDLSERRSLEHSLHEKEAQFETIFEAAPDPVMLVDADDRILMANPAAASVFKSSTSELRGRSLPSLGASETDRVTLDTRRTSSAAAHDVQLLRAGGEAFPARVAVARLPDVEGSAPGHVAIIRDVSEERRREEVLRHSQKMEAIGQLTGGMAHDFNNLLTVIKGNLELLEMTIDEEGARELIAEARGAAGMGASLTQRMLAFARRQSLKPQLVDVNALIVGLSDLLRRTLGERIRLSTSLEPRLSPVLVDSAQLQNAVLNLALNARDAMPSGGSVALETHVHEKPDEALLAIAPQTAGGWVALTVSDTGKGIAPEIRDRLFSPYVTTKAAGQGGGLGLAMVFGFVAQSGGHIAVESEPGAGAAFTIYLPQAGGRPETAAPAPAPLSKAAAGGGQTVLLVEDNESVRKLTSRRLKELGYRVVEAEDGEVALQAIEQGLAFDLLLTDIVMPGALDGVALAAEARARRPDVKVLYTSGYVDPGRMEEAETPGGIELLRKPSSLAELAAAVRRALSG